ncbi:transcriptional regulator [Kordiimonas sediminis]|uniref:Transcriptional regulator n=1 Tax=Kordiimonas sediminis TaxID=1735581 RepID=A0A919AU42_9PROT|nr:TetR/AcrR family transcriptional regulator [Kordiimonas sediminis]GHF23904.1 transcriptional regulator [Kordiimonas sediminis]
MTKRLTKSNWLQHGFTVLQSDGHVALKAGSLVKELGVSRGSFYWHFDSVDDFKSQLLNAWREDLTQSIITDLQSLPNGEEQLTELIHRVITHSQTLEAAIRGWAQVDPLAAAAVKEVDQLRIDYVSNTLVRAGVQEDIARGRATLVVWAHIGLALSPELAQSLPVAFAGDIAHLLHSQYVTTA